MSACVMYVSDLNCETGGVIKVICSSIFTLLIAIREVWCSPMSMRRVEAYDMSLGVPTFVVCGYLN